MIYWQLFTSFFQVGLFSIGGGYVAMPLIEQQIVHHHGWLTMAQFADVVTIAEMTPGPIALNASTFVGTKMGGLLGALVATFGCILPSIIIVMFLAYLYTKYRSLQTVQGVLRGLRPAVVGLIASAGMSITALALWNGTLRHIDFAAMNPVAIGLFGAALFATLKWKLNPVLVMIGTGALGLIAYSLV